MQISLLLLTHTCIQGRCCRGMRAMRTRCRLRLRYSRRRDLRRSGRRGGSGLCKQPNNRIQLGAPENRFYVIWFFN